MVTLGHHSKRNKFAADLRGRTRIRAKTKDNSTHLISSLFASAFIRVIPVDGIGQSEKQTDQAAKDLVKKFLKNAKKLEKKKAWRFAGEDSIAVGCGISAEESRRSVRSDGALARRAGIIDTVDMPEISRFFGIVIAIYYKEHGVPHFHAKYAGQTGVFSIVDLEQLKAVYPNEWLRLCLSGPLSIGMSCWRIGNMRSRRNRCSQSRLWSRRMMHFVKDVKYLSEYKLLLTFEDGSLRQVDLAPHLDGEVFEPLKDMSNFKSVLVNSDLDTIVWKNGADMSPDFLYEIGVPVAESVPAA